MIDHYWRKFLVMHVIAVAIVSKSFYVIVLVTWGRLPDRFYDVYAYIGNWPSLITGTFPYFYDRLGTKGIDMADIYDIKSLLVNMVGWLPVGLIVGYGLRKWKSRP